jgi:hypothetical protein
MSGSTVDFSMSTHSLNSAGSQNEDWDRSESDIHPPNNKSMTPRNSVVFPADGAEKTPSKGVTAKGERTLSELLKMHAEKGTVGRFSADEASRVAEVLGQWVCVLPFCLSLSLRQLLVYPYTPFARIHTHVNYS